MSMDRRKFFKGAAVAPIVAAIGLPAVATMLPSEVPPVASTVSKYPWVWRISTDGGELYTDEFETEEQARAALADYAGERSVLIAECKSQDFDLRIDYDDIYEAMHGRNESEIGDGEFIEATREQEGELENAINAVIAAWAEKHKLNKEAWLFAGTRNEIRADALDARISALTTDTTNTTNTETGI